MKNKIKLFSTLIILILSISLVGCGVEETNTETFDDTAIITKVAHEDAYTTIIMIPCGKHKVPQTTHYSEKFNIFIEYEGVTYSFDNEDCYNMYKNNLNSKVNCTFNKINYSDGSSRIKLISINNLE